VLSVVIYPYHPRSRTVIASLDPTDGREGASTSIARGQIEREVSSSRVTRAPTVRE
jgi:hypothetical protein